MVKVALVTGGSSGLGRAIALRLARDGVLVAVHYGSNRGAAEQVVQRIEAGGGQAFALGADVARVEAIRALYRELDAELARRTGEPRFDVLVNSAGIIALQTAEQATEEAFDKQFAVNVKGLFFVTQMAIPRLRDGGRIINLGTSLTRFTHPTAAVYAASKGAVEVLTPYLAAQLGGRGITVNSLSPGATDTEMNAAWIRSEEGRRQAMANVAIPRVGMPDDIADVAAFLASDASRWVTGQRLEASGGAHL
jgi:NAD(P)-dependent dehydrogenase (short-subunit alcohol dehydrogenase family)